MPSLSVTLCRLLSLMLCFTLVVPGWAADPSRHPRPPALQTAGPWYSGHVQGIAVDRKGGYIYYSFTNLLAKYDFHGRLIGTLRGWSGHLGDLDFNPADGKVYGSLEYGKEDAFYIAVIDGARLDRVGMTMGEADMMRAIYLAEVTKDYAADLDGEGKVTEDASSDHRYGCSGIDGVSFGPAFGRIDGPQYLTVAYGIYGDKMRTDNDHQILLQYDIGEWDALAKPIDENMLHHSGPATMRGKYFVRTGNTRYGVQNLAYDPTLHRWFMGVYQGNKPVWPNYLLFAVDGHGAPILSDLIGVRGRDGAKWEKGLLLPLAPEGLHDTQTGIRGWNQKADVGFQPLGDGLYYLVQNAGAKGRQSAEISLMRWTGDPSRPFEPAASR
ncbi:hypothetical protein MOK15_21780 [Sphingobium sp. BYY-5]|uniref:hypothetical protein n=1 Tax=Sphingobium sp. BYY-5 TaxID=2926400 RepID=UPI001FA6ACAC|nr:hypothetical protein [Sphingobium sp. BYY-5]MCI4592692.1 hypothetical protein [Sphingobium sp. BYY-5]